MYLEFVECLQTENNCYIRSNSFISFYDYWFYFTLLLTNLFLSWTEYNPVFKVDMEIMTMRCIL